MARSSCTKIIILALFTTENKIYMSTREDLNKYKILCSNKDITEEHVTWECAHNKPKEKYKTVWKTQSLFI